MVTHKVGSMLWLFLTLLWLAAIPAFAAALVIFIEAQVDGVSGVNGLAGASAVTVSPDGKHVYVTGATDHAVAVFSRAAITGTLTFTEMQQNGAGDVEGLLGASSVAVSPDGKHVYVTGRLDSAVTVFSRSEMTGTLTFIETHVDDMGGVNGLDGANSIAISPDGRHIYVAGKFDNAVAVFSRNEVTGALTFIEAKLDDTGGVNGLDGANSIAISPDGRHIYVAGSFDNAVAVFSRNEVTGALTFIEAKLDDTGGVNGVDGATGVAVSPDGRHVYVTGPFDEAVAVFSRNITTGMLTFIELKENQVDDVTGLRGGSSVTVSSDGEYVYATGATDNALVLFSRDGTTGKLTFIKVEQDGVNSINGLAGAKSVAVSPDGQSVYVAGQSDNAVAVFGPGLKTYLPFILK